MTDNKELYEETRKLLEAKGLKFGEIIKVRNAYAKWGKEYDDEIEYSHKHNVYTSKKVSMYGFGSEKEVRLLNALIDFLPEDTRVDKIMQIMAILFKLFDVQSEWSFNPKS